MPGLSTEFFAALARVQNLVPGPAAFDAAARYFASSGFLRMTADYLDLDGEPAGHSGRDLWVGRVFDSSRAASAIEDDPAAFWMCAADNPIMGRFSAGDMRPFILVPDRSDTSIALMGIRWRRKPGNTVRGRTDHGV